MNILGFGLGIKYQKVANNPFLNNEQAEENNYLWSDNTDVLWNDETNILTNEEQ